jgi:hypothetical protein
LTVIEPFVSTSCAGSSCAPSGIVVVPEASVTTPSPPIHPPPASVAVFSSRSSAPAATLNAPPWHLLAAC